MCALQTSIKYIDETETYLGVSPLFNGYLSLENDGGMGTFISDMEFICPYSKKNKQKIIKKDAYSNNSTLLLDLFIFNIYIYIKQC